jgi:membrane-associated phospholipid phosphatase
VQGQPQPLTAPQTSAEAAPTEQAPAYHDYFNALGYSFTHGLFNRDQVLPLAIGSAAALAFVPVDQRISDSLRGTPSGFGRAGEFIGGPIMMAALSGGLIAGSLATDNQHFRSYAFTFSQGLIVAESLATAVKLAVRRTRPDGTSQYSFPSGHAAASFALATVTTHYYGAKAGVPLYALASLISLSRLTYGKHFPSDVVFGATVGYISAKAAIRGAEHVTSGHDTSGVALSARGFSFYLRF